MQNKRRITSQNISHVIYDVVKTLSNFIDREDKVKLIPHLKAFHKKVEYGNPSSGRASCVTSLGFEKDEICGIYQFFGNVLVFFPEYKLSMELAQLELKIR